MRICRNLYKKLVKSLWANLFLARFCLVEPQCTACCYYAQNIFCARTPTLFALRIFCVSFYARLSTISWHYVISFEILFQRTMHFLIQSSFLSAPNSVRRLRTAYISSRRQIHFQALLPALSRQPNAHFNFNYD